MSTPDWGTTRGLWPLVRFLIRASPGRQAIYGTSALVADAVVPLSAFGIKLLTEGVIGGDAGRAVFGGAVLAGAGVAVDGLYWTGMALQFSLIERVGHAVDGELMRLSGAVPGTEHLERSDYHDRVELLREERDDLANLPVAAVRALSVVIRSAITLFLLASLHPLLLALPLFGLPSLFIGRRNARQSLAVAEEVAEAQRHANAVFDLATMATTAKEMRIFRLGSVLLSRHRDDWTAVDQPLRAVERRVAMRAAAGWTVFALGFGLAAGFIVRRAAHGAASAGDVAFALLLATQVNSSLNWAVTTAGWFQYSVRAAMRFLWLREYTATAVARSQPPSAAVIPGQLADGITFRGVSFLYPGTDLQVLRHVDLRLPAGAVVALVGENGAGKTTLVKLLCRFHEPTSGAILLDDQDLAETPPDAWRSRVSVALQDHARFELLAREAVGVGDLAAIDDGSRVELAVESAAAGDIVERLSDGLATQLGRSFDQGQELSGGQWQKLALARSMMRVDPLLLVLDEPTAALDPHSEHALFEGFAARAARARQRSGAITLLVSHRFSTVRMADLIVVLQHGQITEVGSHRDLVARGGVYAELYELQARAYR
jgi:ATP-binding cassette subfamily B protein